LDALLEKLALDPMFSSLAGMVPTLPSVSFNENLNPGGRKDFRRFDNNLVVTKKMAQVRNLYQFNAEFRNRVKKMGEAIAQYRQSNARDEASALNAVKYLQNFKASATEYAFVGSVFNRRNVIGFDGEAVILHTRCRFLLAHDTSKNKFSVVLNYNEDKSPLSLYLHGKAPLHLSAEGLKQDTKSLSLPWQLKTDTGVIYASRINNGICVTIDYEMKVCCYEDTGSCSVAFTRLYTGRVNGLFGKSDQSTERIEQADWAVDKCKIVPRSLMPPKREAVEKCYQAFGEHKRAQFRNSLEDVSPRGWYSLCKTVVSAVPENFCKLTMAFSEAARLQNVVTNVPVECYKCKNTGLNKLYNIGQKVSSLDGEESDVEQGTDFVFVSIACNSTQFAFNYNNLLAAYQKTKDARSSNNIYVVKVDGQRVSVFQTDDSKITNFDLAKNAESLKRSANQQTEEDVFKEAIFYAQSLFARRLASARHLVILSCGNCVSTKALKVSKLASQLEKQNIIVSSWGLYQMKFVNSDDESIGKIVGYDESKLYYVAENEIDSDTKSSFKFDHNIDACKRLADKTHGTEECYGDYCQVVQEDREASFIQCQVVPFGQQ